MSRRPTVLLFALAVGACSVRPPQTPGPAEPTLEPSPTPTAATPTPTLSAAASPSATLTPSLEPGALELLELEATGCPGGVALDWSAALHPAFHHYTALRSLDPNVETAYPPIAPAIDWGDSYATDRFVTSAVDATLIPSELVFHYRVMAYDASNRPLSASNTVRAQPVDAIDLGQLAAEAQAGGTQIEWDGLGGSDDCFTAYRVLVGPAGSEPATTLTVVTDPDRTSIQTDGLASGTQYALRVDAVRSTTLGSFVVGRTDVTTYSAP